MTGLAKLGAHTAELNAAIETFTSHCRNMEYASDLELDPGNASQPLIPPEAPAEAHRARRPIMANIAKLQTLLAEPADFLQELARQVGLSPSPATMLVDTDTRANGLRLRRTSYLPASVGLASFKSSPVYHFRAAFQLKTSQRLLGCPKTSSVELYG